MIPRALAPLALALAGAVGLSACTPVRIKLQYRVRQPSPEHSGRVVFGTLTDERRNPREVAPDVTVAPGSPSMPMTIETMIRQGLAFAGFAVVPEAPLRIDARLHTAWAQQTFYSVQANVQLTVSLVEVASGRTVWTNRFGVVESMGGADARTNHQAAYKKALTRLAGQIADAFAASTFAEAAAAAGRGETPAAPDHVP